MLIRRVLLRGLSNPNSSSPDSFGRSSFLTVPMSWSSKHTKSTRRVAVVRTVRCGFALAALLMLMGSANAQQAWCPGNRVVHVLVGRDEYWIPTRYDPHFEVDEGE